MGNHHDCSPLFWLLFHCLYTSHLLFFVLGLFSSIQSDYIYCLCNLLEPISPCFRWMVVALPSTSGRLFLDAYFLCHMAAFIQVFVSSVYSSTSAWIFQHQRIFLARLGDRTISRRPFESIF